MKKWLVLALFFIVAVGLGTGVTAIYIQKQKTNQEQAAQAARDEQTKEAAEKASTQSQLDKLASTISVLRAECQKGVSAYGQLTAAQKQKTPAPLCDAGTN